MTQDNEWWWDIYENENRLNMCIKIATEADARAKLAIYLKEKGLI